MESSLKQKTISGIMWSGVQRFGTLGIGFISNIVLARMLSPDDYGCVGMLAIFIVISNTFIEGGFGTALIQKKEATQKDYSTIFWWNLALSSILYMILYIGAPYIADFYNLPLLSSILRVQSIILIINALGMVQQTKLRKELLFKKIATVNLVAVIISVLIAIYLAFIGWGVWSLVAQQIILCLLNTTLFTIAGRWTPSLVFSKDSFTNLFSFGGFILLSNFINTFCDNIQGLLIGKFVNSSTLGLYTQARKIEDIATSSISGVVNQVAYPVLADRQNEKDVMINILKKFITFIAFIVFPLMFLLVLVAEPLITLLYGVKWVSCVPYFQILCIAGLAISLQTINYNAVAAVGKSDVLFRWTIIKRILGLLFNVLGFFIWGIYGLLFGGVLTAFTLYLINVYLSSKYVGYRIRCQLLDLLPIILTSMATFAIMGAVRYIMDWQMYIESAITIILYIVVYAVLSRFINPYIFQEFKFILVGILQKNKNNLK